MKLRRPALLPALWAVLLLAVSGCANLDTTPAGNPDRSLNGAVVFEGTLPAGTEILVRLLEPSANEKGRSAGADFPVAAPSAGPRPDRLLGETRLTLAAAAMQPVPFKLDYFAEDALLRRGLNLDVRVSFGGKVRLRTVNAHVVTLAGSPFRQDVNVQAVR
ncbi:MAG: hypothetical protein B9S34_16255 [Opitutia bacterium Tous-C1TDCM]|nr:MAG: hypothetical protein B9S34_16255 [Opitutae bacterium Tous-C1TDCM]